jgi:2Fe-2S iron-sulfur cluster binding domain
VRSKPQQPSAQPVAQSVGTLVSVNVGMPKNVPWQGKSVYTAALGIDAARIHTEPFGPAPGVTPGIAATPARRPHPPAGKPGNGATVAFARSNLAVPWSKDYGSLLELAEACDVPVRWSCRTGLCHTCETTLIAGDVG